MSYVSDCLGYRVRRHLLSITIGFPKGFECVAPILLPFHFTELCAERNPQITYIDLLRGVRCASMYLSPHCIVFTPAGSHSEILKKKYSQKPQLSATHKVVSHRLVSLATLTPHLPRIKTYILSCNRMDDWFIPGRYSDYSLCRVLLCLSSSLCALSRIIVPTSGNR